MWSPGNNIVKQYKMAAILQGGGLKSAAFSLVKRRAIRKQILFLNVLKFMSFLIAQNSCHLCEEAINIHNHKNAFRHPEQNQCHIILVYYSL